MHGTENVINLQKFPLLFAIFIYTELSYFCIMLCVYGINNSTVQNHRRVYKIEIDAWYFFKMGYVYHLVICNFLLQEMRVNLWKNSYKQ